MHLGRSSKVILLVVCLFAFSAKAQLNHSNEIIETIQDINLQDDSQSDKNQSQTKPKNEEEFQKEKIPDDDSQKQVEDEIKENNPEEPAARKEITNDQAKSYEDSLKQEAEKNKKKVEDDIESEDTGFAVDKPEAAPQEVKPIPTEEEETVQEDQAVKEQDVAAPAKKSQDEVNAPTLETDVQTDAQYEDGELAEHYIGPNTEPSDAERERLRRVTHVEIEENPYQDVNTQTTKLSGILRSFKERRPTWTTEFELGSSNYQPSNYFSPITDAISSEGDFKSTYNKPQTPFTGIAVDFKRNFGWGAISLGLGFDYLQATATNASLALTVPSVRAHLYLDTLFNEPYVVPYATAGYSYFSYRESYTDASNPLDVSGKTDNFFVGFGLLFQLDWADMKSHANAYEDMGLENTFLFVEGKTFLDKGIRRAADDPDFTSGTFLAGGIKFEF